MPDSAAHTNDGSGLRALLLFLTGGLTLWAAFNEYSKYQLRVARLASQPRTAGVTPPTYPGRVVPDEPMNFGRTPQGVTLDPQVGDETLAQALKRVRTKVIGVKRHTIQMKTLEERIGALGRMIREGSVDDDIKAAGAAVLSRKCGDRWCVGPKDYVAEADALFEAVTDPKSPIAMRYTLDHPVVDEFGSAKRGMRMRTGDCDDLSVYLGALLASQGHRPELVTMEAKGAGGWSHIFLRDPINLDDGTGAGKVQYRYLDPSMQTATGWQPAGWVPPGVEAALQGHNGHGITARARAFRLF